MYSFEDVRWAKNIGPTMYNFENRLMLYKIQSHFCVQTNGNQSAPTNKRQLKRASFKNCPSPISNFSQFR